MPVPTLITELSQTAGSNYPAGSESPATLDNYQRAHASFIAMLRDGIGQTNPASLASASTCNIGGQNSLYVEITGTTGISSFGTNYNGPRYLRFQGVLTLTHSASLNLPGAANITTAAGDTCILVPNLAVNGWNVVQYQRAAGVPATAGANADITSTSALTSMTGVQKQTWATRADVASATTTDLTSATDDIRITGTTAITGFTIAAGRLVRVTAGGAFTLTNNSAIVTQTGGNIVAVSGDTFMLRATAADTVEVLSYVPSILAQQTTRSMVRLNTVNGYGSTNTRYRRFTTTVTSQGTDITYADSAANGASFTINVAGVYAVTFTDNYTSADTAQIAMNDTAPTGSSVAADILASAATGNANVAQCVAATFYAAAGAVIRARSQNGTAVGTAVASQFTIVRVA